MTKHANTTTTEPRRPPEEQFLDELFSTKRGGKRITKTAVGEFLGISKMAVSHWKRVPAAHARAIAEEYGFPLKRVRPDLYDSTYAREVSEARERERAEA